MSWMEKDIATLGAGREPDMLKACGGQCRISLDHVASLLKPYLQNKSQSS
jgi:hypothetical protein